MGKKSAFDADSRGGGRRTGNGASRTRDEATRTRDAGCSGYSGRSGAAEGAGRHAGGEGSAGVERFAGAKRKTQGGDRDSADARSSLARQSSRKPAMPASDFPYPPDELLARGLAELGFPESDGLYRSASVRGVQSIIPLISRYIKELELFNAVFDLVGAEPGTDRGRSDLVVRHILDSLAPWKEIAAEAARILGGDAAGDAPVVMLRDAASQSASAGSFATVPAEGTTAGEPFVPCVPEIADVGSGAGFPGIPLAMIFPDFRFTLVERMSKRCAFLENCVAILGLKNVTVLNSEMEKAPPNRFDIVVFRAFRPLDREMVRGLLALTRSADDSRAPGILAAWKARADKISAEMDAIADELDGWRVLPLTVPFLANEERNLVVTASAKRPSRPR